MAAQFQRTFFACLKQTLLLKKDDSKPLVAFKTQTYGQRAKKGAKTS